MKIGFQIGPSQDANMPDYHGDLPSSPYDPNVCVGRAAALICLISLGTSFVYPYGDKTTANNLWVSFGVYYNEIDGITMSGITISNYYSGQAYLSNVNIDDGSSSYYVYNSDVQMPSGFGSDFTVPNTGGSYQGNEQVVINIYHLANSPNDSVAVPNNLNFVLPSVPNLKYFMQTGEVLPTIGLP